MFCRSPNMVSRSVLFVLCFVIGCGSALQQVTAAEWLAEAGKQFQGRDFVAARRSLERAVDTAQKEQNTQVEADARSYLGDFLSSRRRHTSFDCDWSSDVCSSD